jgi:hypothetical protein
LQNIFVHTRIIKIQMLNCYCQLSSSVIFRQYGVSQSECKIDRPRPGLPRLSPRPHTGALGTRLEHHTLLNHARKILYFIYLTVLGGVLADKCFNGLLYYYTLIHIVHVDNFPRTFLSNRFSGGIAVM